MVKKKQKRGNSYGEMIKILQKRLIFFHYNKVTYSIINYIFLLHIV